MAVDEIMYIGIILGNFLCFCLQKKLFLNKIEFSGSAGTHMKLTKILVSYLLIYYIAFTEFTAQKYFTIMGSTCLNHNFENIFAAVLFDPDSPVIYCPQLVYDMEFDFYGPY